MPSRFGVGCRLACGIFQRLPGAPWVAASGLLAENVGSYGKTVKQTLSSRPPSK